eukprot:936431-Pelagomonas_calceolata.AAC.7
MATVKCTDVFAKATVILDASTAKHLTSRVLPCPSPPGTALTEATLSQYAGKEARLSQHADREATLSQQASRPHLKKSLLQPRPHALRKGSLNSRIVRVSR